MPWLEHLWSWQIAVLSALFRFALLLLSALLLNKYVPICFISFVVLRIVEWYRKKRADKERRESDTEEEEIKDQPVSRPSSSAKKRRRPAVVERTKGAPRALYRNPTAPPSARTRDEDHIVYRIGGWISARLPTQHNALWYLTMFIAIAVFFRQMYEFRVSIYSDRYHGVSCHTILHAITAIVPPILLILCIYAFDLVMIEAGVVDRQIPLIALAMASYVFMEVYFYNNHIKFFPECMPFVMARQHPPLSSRLMTILFDPRIDPTGILSLPARLGLTRP